MLATGHGGWWSDGGLVPRTLVLHCGTLRLLRGDPALLTPDHLAPLQCGQFTAPDAFLPLLSRTFESLLPWRRAVLLRLRPALRPAGLPRDTVVRRLNLRDTTALQSLSPSLHWIWDTWGSPAALAAGGRSLGAFVGGRLAAVGCGYLLGRDHEDLAVATEPELQRRGAALAVITELVADVRARGRTASWTTPVSNEASLALAEAAGFERVRTDTAYWCGRARAPRPSAV